ncbi:eukaryotic translation initiation factor 3 subunit, putative [Entamoeba invadens IP1]|uniref:Eukaryotic translation initiation factor 3 subunit, putative n=1 Tax=Entamoeba invadens TaxID=33085 RepID=S0B4V8_ENTIV|nr:eukaryotic translation initiation factor 3 subunit, putative [Entamoeba invadens IP1]ELP93197.1 eukaryotic translation initiation factor 3 subunit, putative [Entamoeba invadens IP1]BAN40862.1 eukaryotic translation initiation factor 3 subunit, putative [Entamoeba invadens]|eukprot:XP_004259968.1 eukaryotic translation initiation factor 3 subunit, putative [Entamoeba invadens IP1]
MSWEDFDEDQLAEMPEEGQTTATLNTLVAEKKEDVTISNKELKQKKAENKVEEKQYVDPLAGLSEEDKAAALKRKQVETDAQSAKKLYAELDETKQLETMSVVTDKDFMKFGQLLGIKGHSLYTEKSKQFKLLVKECLRELTIDMNSIEVKEIASYADVLFNQKIQLEKEEKKKRKPTKKALPKATLGKKGNEVMDDGDDDVPAYEDLDDDFM